MARERGSRLVDIAGQVKHRTRHPDGTPKGLLFYDGVREVWLPCSLVEWHEKDGVVVMPEWLAQEKELI